MRNGTRLLVAAVIAMAAMMGVQAQSELGRIEGVVTDPSGLPIPGARVSATGPTGARSVVTDDKGVYRIFLLTPGTWRVHIELSGFRTVEVDVPVEAGKVTSFDAVLTVGALTEEVTVTGAPRIDGRRVEAPRTERAAPPPAPPALAPTAVAPYWNTEKYAPLEESRERLVHREPLSTFSVDVDTASYANVRRFLLDQNTLPPPDAVRIEEMINYFTYGYPDPRGSDPISVTAELGPCPWDASRRLALVGLQARRMDLDQAPPMNLVFLVDVSGSMHDPRKLPLVKESLRLLAEGLRARDRVAIVVYAGASGLVLDSTPGTRRHEVVAALERLQAGGSTNGGAGIELAYRIAAENRIGGGVNRVVLATDGDFNVGTTGTGDLVRLVEQQRENGTTLSVLGFGMGNLRDELLERLADKGNGNYAYVDTMAEARKVLREQVAGTLVTVAKDVKVQVEFNPARVAAYRLIGYENRHLENEDFRDDRKDAGDMGAGHAVTALYEIVPAGQPVAEPFVEPLRYQRASPRPTADHRSREWLVVKVRYKAPDGHESRGLEQPLVPGSRDDVSPELRFAAAVARFGMLLRRAEAGSADYAAVAEEARSARGPDPHGWRAELLQLVEQAGRLTRHRSARR